jgi:DNA-binding IclR family transcriptional regulator
MAERIIARGLPRSARNTIIDPEKFRAELRKVRAQGYAYDDLEFHDDMRCVAVPVVDKSGLVVSGISLSGPRSRYTLPTLARLKDFALNVANELSRVLGGSSAPAERGDGVRDLRG